MKAASLLIVIIIATMPAQNASAALPYSTYGVKNGWWGYKDYKKDGFDVRLIFNVYDTQDYPGEFTWGGEAAMPDTDRYIYAYQVFNISDSQDIGVFSLLDKTNNLLAQQLMHSSCAQTDGTSSSVAPDPEVCLKQGIWEWSASGGFLSAGTNSWYLIFSSGSAPVKGSYKVEQAAPETEPPVPEPATLALFGAASAMFAANRRIKRRSG